MTVTNPFPPDTSDWYRAEARNEILRVEREGMDTPPRRDAYARALIFATLAINARPYYPRIPE